MYVTSLPLPLLPSPFSLLSSHYLLLYFCPIRILFTSSFLIFIHEGGKTLAEAFEHTAVAMYNYMVEIDTVDPKTDVTIEVSGNTILILALPLSPLPSLSLSPYPFLFFVYIISIGHDMESLLYNFLDEWLFQFSTEFIVCNQIKINEFDKEAFKIKATGYNHPSPSLFSPLSLSLSFSLSLFFFELNLMQRVEKVKDWIRRSIPLELRSR